jgi:hypothetical protein
MTVSDKQYQQHSDEFIIHVENEYDYRYIVKGLKNTILDVLRNQIRQQFKKGIR